MNVFCGAVSLRLRIGLIMAVLVVLGLFSGFFFVTGITQPLAFDISLIIALSAFCVHLVLGRAGQIRVVLAAEHLYFTKGSVDSDQVLECAGLALAETKDEWLIRRGETTVLALKRRWFAAAERGRLDSALRERFPAQAEAGAEVESEAGGGVTGLS